VEVRVVPDEEARVLAVRSGEAHIALYPPVESETVLAGRDDAFFRASPVALQSVMMPMNVQRPPFGETEVRRAWSHALDYDVLGTDVTRGIFDVARGLYPSGSSFAVDNQRFDLVEAQRLLDAAGWLPGDDGVRERDGQRLEVVLVALGQAPETQTLAVAIQAQARLAGFDVEIVVAEDQASSTEDPDAWNTSLQLSGTLSASGQPSEAFGRYFAADGDRNRGGIDDARLDAIVPQLFAAADTDERDALLIEAQEIIVAEQAYVLVPAFKRFLAVVGPDYQEYVVSNVRRHVTMETRPSSAG
jgi:peptide/nickel transport system substrate-binding protein